MSAILAFDTSGELMHIGLRIGTQTWVREAAGGAKASAELLPAILALLERAGAALADLDAIAFGCGPGAFTGLRTACSVAQGLALGAGKPVLAIDTLMAVAEDARKGEPQMRTWVAMDARMDQIYAAQYGYERGQWTVLDAPTLTSVDELNRVWQGAPPQHLAGSALVAFADRLECAPRPTITSSAPRGGMSKVAEAHLLMSAPRPAEAGRPPWGSSKVAKPHLLVSGSAQHHAAAAPRGAALLALAMMQWEQGAVLDPSAAVPRYVRDKVAHTVAERAAAKRTAYASGGPTA